MTGHRPTPDTTDLRTGVPVSDALLALLPLIGTWRGTGLGLDPTSGDQFAFDEQLVVAHDGGPFLVWHSWTWRAGAATTRESGFWRPGPTLDDIEAVLADVDGRASAWAGTAGDRRWELATTATAYPPTVSGPAAERRLYALVDDDLVYVTEQARVGSDFAPRRNGRLAREK